jgi:formylglycine-generating enzyme required for sulfatase activity
MGGNVAQWCADGYAPYREGSIKDPIGEENRNWRNLRGGSWNLDHSPCRAACRNANDPGYINSDIGFRVVLRPAAPAP